MHDAVPDELSMGKSGYHAENPLLLAKLQIGLKTNQVIKRVLQIFCAQLKHCPGPVPGFGSLSPTGFMGPNRMASCPLAASTSMGMHPSYTLGFPRIKAVYRRTLRTHQFIGKEVILFFIHRTVDIVAVPFTVPGRCKALFHVKAFPRHYGAAASKKHRLPPQSL